MLESFLPKLTCSLIIKETQTQVFSVNLSNFLTKPILQNTCKSLVLDFEQFYMSHFIIHFIKRNSKKGNYYILNVFNKISTSKNYRQKKLDSKMQLFVIFCLEELDWELRLGISTLTSKYIHSSRINRNLIFSCFFHILLQ